MEGKKLSKIREWEEKMETNENGPSEKDIEWKEPKQEEVEPLIEDKENKSAIKESTISPEQKAAAIKFCENRISELNEAVTEYRKAESVFRLEQPKEDFGFPLSKSEEQNEKSGWLAERLARKTLQTFEKKYGSIPEVRDRITKLESELQQYK